MNSIKGLLCLFLFIQIWQISEAQDFLNDLGAIKYRLGIQRA